MFVSIQSIPCLTTSLWIRLFFSDITFGILLLNLSQQQLETVLLTVFVNLFTCGYLRLFQPNVIILDVRSSSSQNSFHIINPVSNVVDFPHNCVFENWASFSNNENFYFVYNRGKHFLLCSARMKINNNFVNYNFWIKK